MQPSVWKMQQQKEREYNSLIYKSYYAKPLQKNWIYFESIGGRSLSGNLLRIAEELLNEEYGNLKFFAFIQEERIAMTEKLLANYGLNDTILFSNRTEALEIMEQCGFIFSNSSLPQKFVKREGQIIINTWHGTPLKHMGKSVPFERHNIGISQRFFLNCDYILSPNSLFQNVLLNDYMLNNIFPGKILNSGYPRNTVFLTIQNRK